MKRTFICAIWQEKFSLLLDTIPIKSIHDGKKVLCSLIAQIIKQSECSATWKIVAPPGATGSSKIKGIDFDHSYSPVAHGVSFKIDISIVDIHRLTSRILDVSNTSQNTNVPIYGRVCVSPTPHYLDWFEIYYPNVPLNIYDVSFCLRCMNGIQGTKASVHKLN